MSVPSWKRGESKLDLFITSQEFALYVLKITSNEKVFKDYGTIKEKLIMDAMNIHRFLWLANNTKLGDPKRAAFQGAALSACTSFLVTWNLAERAYHLRKNRVNYAISTVLAIQETAKKWMRNDADRLAKPEA